MSLESRDDLASKLLEATQEGNFEARGVLLISKGLLFLDFFDAFQEISRLIAARARGLACGF